MVSEVKQLHSRAKSLAAKFKPGSGTVYIDKAIALDRKALKLCPPDHPMRSVSLTLLSIHLWNRYSELGSMKDLNNAITLGRKALELRLPGHPDRSISLDNLAFHLFARYNLLSAMEDLDGAIVLDQEALELRPLGHPYRSMSLSNLALHLSARYSQLGKMEDLDTAIILDREALELRPLGHPYRSMSLSNLALHLSTRYKKLGEIEDIEKAISLERDALALRSAGHPYRSISLNNLAAHLSAQYDRLATAEHLDEAIDLAREALLLRPPGHPDRSQALENLAGDLHTRFMQSSRSEDKEQLFSIYATLKAIPQTVSSSDLSAARAWVRVAEAFQHPTTLVAYETYFQLLAHHLATLPSLPQHHSVFKDLTSSLAVDAFSAGLRNHSCVKAVELLEQGRGVFWSQLARLQPPLEDVDASGPAGKMLADEFKQLTSLIQNVLHSSGPDQHDRVCNLNVKLNSVVMNIRKLPGLSRFLLPSHFSNLQQAACQGPVIIVNASQYGCDALIIVIDRDPIHIPLSITKEDVQEFLSMFRTLITRAAIYDVKKKLCLGLRRLWNEVVSPIVDTLRVICPLQSRIWWCPTAEFTLLPLHAAAPFKKGQQQLSDLYISSYTPTLTALIRARRYILPHSAAQVKRFTAIGQANAIGLPNIFSIDAELASIGQYIDDLTTFKRIEGEECSIARVTEELGKSNWVHIACHGVPYPSQPFQSAFALHDGFLTVQQIIQCNLENAEFAYLSACYTTIVDDEGLDEGIHLASAIQFAGFCSVIGTMCAIQDDTTCKITSLFYNQMKDESGHLDCTRAAFALNKTMKRADIPFDQRIGYIHLGA